MAAGEFSDSEYVFGAVAGTRVGADKGGADRGDGDIERNRAPLAADDVVTTGSEENR